MRHQMGAELRCGEGNPRNSEGSFITLNDGTIAFYYTRYCGDSAHDHGKAEIALIRSGDNGASWSDSSTVIPPPETGNVMSVSLLRMADGRIMMVYLQKTPLPGTNVIDCRPLCRISADEGGSWSDAVTMIAAPGYFVGNNDHLVQTQEGRILYPVSLHNWNNFNGITFVCCSDDNGETWHLSRTILPPADNIDLNTGLQEPGVFQHPDGTVECWQRTNNRFQYHCFSGDLGETWDTPRPAPAFPSNRSPLQIKRNPADGTFIAVWNDTSIARWQTPADCSSWCSARQRLVAAFSSDGKNWGDHYQIEYSADGGYCYPAVTFTADKAILVACCFAEDSPKNCLKNLRINKIFY